MFNRSKRYAHYHYAPREPAAPLPIALLTASSSYRKNARREAYRDVGGEAKSTVGTRSIIERNTCHSTIVGWQQVWSKLDLSKDRLSSLAITHIAIIYAGSGLTENVARTLFARRDSKKIPAGDNREAGFRSFACCGARFIKF